MGACSIGMSKYHVSQIELGKGAFGVVNKATNKYTGEDVAIKKMLKGSRMYNETLVKREIRIGKLLKHPNLCRFIEYHDALDNLFMVLEYCTDGDLTDRIRLKGNKIEESDGQEWMYQVLDGVRFMHLQRVCHRDIKPDNFMFTRGYKVLKLCDFGIATICPDGEMLKDNCGTPAFKSPEMIELKYDLACDIWAVGLVLYAIITGNKHPFIKNDKLNMADLMAGRISFEQDIMGKLGSAVRQKWQPDAKNLCKEMCSKDPQTRPTAAQCLERQWLSTAKENISSQIETQMVIEEKIYEGCDISKESCTLQ